MISLNKILVWLGGTLLGLIIFSFVGFFFNSTHNSTIKENKVSYLNTTKKVFIYKFQQNNDIPKTATIKTHLATTNHLWIGTVSMGLWKSKEADGIGLSRVETDKIKSVNYIYQDDLKNIWVGAKSGLWKLATGSLNFMQTSIKSNTTLIFQENNKNKTIWVVVRDHDRLQWTNDHTTFNIVRISFFWIFPYTITAIWNDPKKNNEQVLITASSVSGGNVIETTFFSCKDDRADTGSDIYLQIPNAEVVTNFLYENKQYLGLSAVNSGQGGLILYDNDNQKYTTVIENDLVSSHITDNSGNLWVSTDNHNKKGGIYILRKDSTLFQKQAFPVQNGFENVYQARSSDGDLWACQEGGALFRWEPGRLKFSAAPVKLWPKLKVSSIFQNFTQLENIYIGTIGSGLWSTKSFPAIPGSSLTPGKSWHFNIQKLGMIITIISAIVLLVSSVCIVLYLFLRKRNPKYPKIVVNNSVKSLNAVQVYKKIAKSLRSLYSDSKKS